MIVLRNFCLLLICLKASTRTKFNQKNKRFRRNFHERRNAPIGFKCFIFGLFCAFCLIVECFHGYENSQEKLEENNKNLINISIVFALKSSRSFLEKQRKQLATETAQLTVEFFIQTVPIESKPY